jgi:hypothetical protein
VAEAERLGQNGGGNGHVPPAEPETEHEHEHDEPVRVFEPASERAGSPERAEADE